MQKSKYLFGVVCLFMAITLLFTGCAHPWRIANNPYTPVPTEEVDLNASTDPADTDEAEATPAPDAESSDEPSELPSEEPSGEATEEPTGDSTGAPDTEPPETDSTASPSSKPTNGPTQTTTPKPTHTATPKPTNTPKPTAKPDIGSFSTTAINNPGVTYDNSMFGKSKITMINIWATSCGPCIQELPHIQQLANKYASRGVNIVTALGDSEQSGMIQLALNIIGGMSGFKLPVLRYNSSFAAQFPAGAYPTTYFIDQNGNILKVVTTSNSYDQWCAILDGLLK